MFARIYSVFIFVTVSVNGDQMRVVLLCVLRHKILTSQTCPSGNVADDAVWNQTFVSDALKHMNSICWLRCDYLVLFIFE